MREWLPSLYNSSVPNIISSGAQTSYSPVKPVCLQLVHPARDGILTCSLWCDLADLTHQPHYSLFLSSSAVGVVVELSSDHYRWVLKDDDQFCAVHCGCILCSAYSNFVLVLYIQSHSAYSNTHFSAVYRVPSSHTVLFCTQ